MIGARAEIGREGAGRIFAPPFVTSVFGTRKPAASDYQTGDRSCRQIPRFRRRTPKFRGELGVDWFEIGNQLRRPSWRMAEYRQESGRRQRIGRFGEARITP